MSASTMFEWEMSADSMYLPPLREFSTSHSSSFHPTRLDPPGSAASQFRGPSRPRTRGDTPLSGCGSPKSAIEASTGPLATRPDRNRGEMSPGGDPFPLPRSGSAASRFGVSRRDHCLMEGIPLNYPSQAELTHEERSKSPRGMAACTVGRGSAGKTPDEVWRVKHRSLKEPLVPLEDTLRKRRVMQMSMSAPVFSGEETRCVNSTRESLQDLYVDNCRRRKRELSQQSTRGSSGFQIESLMEQSSWTSVEATSLVDTCVRLCDWEDSMYGSSSYWSRLPSGVSSASPGASSLMGSSLMGGSQILSPTKASKGMPMRKTPLPSDLLTRMKDRGWKQTDLGKMVWVEQGRQLASLRSAAPAGTGSRAIQERLHLLQHLEKQAVPQGPEALRAALKFRCGSLEQAFRCLDVSDRSGSQSLSLLEFCGALALLGLDAPALCGSAGETAAFAAFDGDRDGRLSLYDLLGESAPAPDSSLTSKPKSEHGAAVLAHQARQKMTSWSSSPSAPVSGQRGDGDGGIEGGAERWALTVRFVALSAWFATPILSRHRSRQDAPKATAALRLDRPETPAVGAMMVVTALAEGATRRASHGALARQQLTDPVRECMAPSEVDMEDVETKMRDHFNRNASAKQNNEQMINKADFFRLLGDIPPMGIGSDPEPRKLTRSQVGDIFDEVLALQAQNGITYSKGLTFESLRLALLKLCLLVGLHFRHLVEDALDSISQVGDNS